MDDPISVKPYTPKGAAKAMLVGKMLIDKDERFCFWQEDNFFVAPKEEMKKGGHCFALSDFTGLYDYESYPKAVI